MRNSKFRIQSLIVLLFILLLLKSERGNGQFYDEYHHMISTAEEFYFLQNNVDSALVYYQRCFEAFDFVFARDAVNAFQIAYKEGQPIEDFLIVTMESGVTPAILSSIPALSDFAKDSLPNLELIQDYDLYRSRYLDRINVKCLNRIYRLGILDQITKGRKTQTKPLFKMALEFGLPGERNCGIEDSQIHKELGRGAADFLSLRDSISEKYVVDLWYYRLDENSLMNHLPIVIMLHDYCTYKDYEKDLHKAYIEGFIHPREIGNIYDNAFRGDDVRCLMVPNKGRFGLNSAVRPTNIIPGKANRLRAKWGISSIETDQKKKELEKLGYRFIWDYW